MLTRLTDARTVEENCIMDRTGWTNYDYQYLIERYQGTGDRIEYLNETKTGRTFAIYIYSLVGRWIGEA